MSQSQKVAAAVALRALGEDVVVDGDGARVAQVIPDTPASAAGILPGDVIVEANDSKIDGVDDLQKTLASVKPGDTVKLAVHHAGRPEDEAPDVRELMRLLA